ncbi:MAG: secretin N-terminal domain-containing protein, partial [Candidatus Hydrogenedentota bacterium]
MTQGRERRFAVASAALLALGAAWAQQPDPEQHINLELSGEPIADAMKVLSDATGFNILLSGTAQSEAKITVFIRDMPAERALEETVRVNGLHYVRNGDVVWVLTGEEYFEDFDLGRERRVVRLRHARAADVATILQSSLSQNAKVTTYPEANVLVIAEVPERIEVLDALIAELDRPTDTRVVQLNHATAQEMLALLQNHVSSPATFQADARTNQLVLTDTPENLDAFERLVREFDRPDLVETRTYQLAYADASEVADLLREVLTGRRRSPTEGAGGMSEPGAREQPQVFTAPESARPGSRSSFELRRGAPTAASVAEPAAQTPAAPAVAADTGVVPLSDEDAALGPLASIAADPRTNTVIITHTAGVLDRLEVIITQVDVPNEFHRYQFQFANPAELELETRLAQLLPVDGAFLNVDASSRTVTFRARTDLADEILELLRTWDYNVRQVVIEAQILSVNVGLIKNLGISWQAVLEDAGNMLDRSIDANVFFPPAIAS